MPTALLKNLDALLVSNPANIRYLTGFTGTSPAERETYVLLAYKKIYLFTSSLYLERARKLANSRKLSAGSRKLEIIELSPATPLAKKLQEVLNFTNTTRLGFEEADLTVAEFNQLKSTLSHVELVPTQRRIEEMRQIKHLDEITYIKRAAQLTDQCYLQILKLLKPGVTESQIAWEIESFFRNNGAECAFSPIVAFGNNSSQPHYLPTASCPLRSNQLVLLDFGARVNGYCADMTRMAYVGKKVPLKVQSAYEAVLDAQQEVITRLKQGERSGAKLDALAREIINKSGFPPYPHSLGHAVGLDIHENPRLTQMQNAILKPGMVFSVEPGVYIESEFGIRIEDLICLKESGIELLSQSPRHLINT